MVDEDTEALVHTSQLSADLGNEGESEISEKKNQMMKYNNSQPSES